MFKSKRYFFTLAGLIVLSAAVFLTGCANGQSLAVLRATAAGQSKGDIVIGAAWPFASNDGGFKDGMDLAESEVNAAGGIDGRQLRIITADDQGSVTQGEAVAQSFANNKQIVAVIGDRNSFVSLPAAKIYQDAGILMLSPGSTAPELTAQGYNLVFRSIPSDSQIAQAVARYAAQRGHKRMVIYYSNDAYGRGLANAFEDSAGKVGIDIVDRLANYGDIAQLADLSKQWQVMGCDGIFIADSLPDGANFAVDVRKVGINVPLFGGNALESPQLSAIGGQAVEGMVIGTVFNPQNPQPEVQQFIKAFQIKYGKMPSQWSAEGYDAVKLLAAAMTQAKSTVPAQIAAQLRSFKNWPGAVGVHTFNQDGDDVGNLVVLKTVSKGKFVVVAGGNPS